jgi:YHS domain-containing protein
MTEVACPVCGNRVGSIYSAEYPGSTCSQECARTFAIVEAAHELTKLLRLMAYPTYTTTPEGGIEVVGRRHSWPAAEPTPLPPEPSWGDGPKPGWWDAVDY